MKRFTAWLLMAAILFLCAPACAMETPEGMASRLAEQVTELAADETYLPMMTGNPDIMAAAEPMAQLCGKQPKAWLMTDLSQNAADVANALGVSDGYAKLSPAARAVMENRILGAVPAMIASAHGAVHIALTNVLTVNEAFVMPEGFAPKALFADYGGDLGVLVLFSQAGEGVASASATLFYKADLQNELWAKIGASWTK